MGKIPNWSRNKRKEKSTRPYRWDNDKTGSSVDVSRLSTGGRGKKVGAYQVYLRKKVSDLPPNQYKTKRIATKDTREEARKKAVKWMQKHPSP